MNKLEIERSFKFNDWGVVHPAMLKLPQEISYSEAIKNNTRKDLSDEEKTAIYVNLMTGCQGIEFVVWANIKSDNPIFLPNNVVLYPVYPSKEELNQLPNDEKSDQVRAFSQQIEIDNRYPYDGWMRIEDFSENISSLSDNIRLLRNVISLFSLMTNCKLEWELKYQNRERIQEGTYDIDDEYLSHIQRCTDEIDQLNSNDKIAIMRSIGWVSQGKQSNSLETGFLYSVLAIESLCDYIEASSINSIFHELKTDFRDKNERRVQRELCIKTCIENAGGVNLTKAVQTAYFDCIVGIRKKLRRHLYKIFGENNDSVKSFIDGAGDEMSLLKLRNHIAHGNYDLMDESELAKIVKYSTEIQQFANSYIWKVVKMSLGYEHVGNARMSIIFTPNMFVME